MTTQDQEAHAGPVVADLSVSLDGFIAGPDDGPGKPLGDGGGPLFGWRTAGTERIGPDDGSNRRHAAGP
jgi:hypothetical protein